MYNPRVSVVRCSNFHGLEGVEKAVCRGLELIGGLESIICPGDRVLIKPNILKAASYLTGVTTNPYLIEAVCGLARQAGAGRVIIGEGAGVGHNTQEAFKETGLIEVARRCRAELIDLKKAEMVWMSIPGGVIFRRLRIPRPVLEANVIINLPVMKTHDAFPATLGLKNIKGVIAESDKKRFHKWGLSQAIVDLNKLLLPQLTILDGTVGMEGLGPVYGTPVNLGLLIISQDTVAADSVAALIMGIEPEEIEYIKLAGEQGLGCNNPSRMEMSGLSIDEVKRPFKVVHLDFSDYEKWGIEINEEGACSGCRHMMESVILSLEKEGKLKLLRGYSLIFGQLVKPSSSSPGKLVSIGLCTRGYKSISQYIPGCPPHPHDVLAFFEELA